MHSPNVSVVLISYDVSVCCVSKTLCTFKTYRTVKLLKRIEAKYFYSIFCLRLCSLQVAVKILLLPHSCVLLSPLKVKLR